MQTDCPICFGKHDLAIQICDSPGAIVTRTTGCVVWDGEPTTEELAKAELKRRVELELQSEIW